jgi:hypothetical protein
MKINNIIKKNLFLTIKYLNHYKNILLKKMNGYKMKKFFIFIIFIILFICGGFSGCIEESNNENNSNNDDNTGYDDYSFYKWCAENQNLIVGYIREINNNINTSDWNTIKYWCGVMEDKIDKLLININYFFLSYEFNSWSTERYNKTFMERFKDILYSYKLFAHNLDLYCDEIIDGNIDDTYYYDKSKEYLLEASEDSYLIIRQMEIAIWE